jgi:hypothetical protein
MTQQAANVIDFTGYRARRVQRSPLTPMTACDLVPSKLVFAVPVLMPIVIPWFLTHGGIFRRADE